MLIEIVEGLWVSPEDVVAVKATGDKSCALYMYGQSAVDGAFAVEYPAEQVAEQINDALETYQYQGEVDKEEEEE